MTEEGDAGMKLAEGKMVRVEGESIIFNPQLMEIDCFYSVILKGRKYLYRKVGSCDIEVYGEDD